MPNAWKRAVTPITRSSDPSPMARTVADVVLTTFSCVSATPLGFPVVPEVYRIVNKSSLRIQFRGRVIASTSSGE